MTSEGAGTGAEVGVRKIDEEGNVEQREGFVTRNWPRYVAYLVFVLAGFGIWKVGEILFSVV